jgi:hypothetical protein
MTYGAGPLPNGGDAYREGLCGGLEENDLRGQYDGNVCEKVVTRHRVQPAIENND